MSAVGFSNGGLMANALACRAARRVRAIVLVAAGYEGLGRCAPAAPVSVLSIHGTSDQVVRLSGHARVRRRRGRGAIAAPRGRARAARSRASRTCAGTAARAGTRVEHLRVADDTHGWPSITDANERMVRFLRVRGLTLSPSQRRHGSGRMMGARRLNRPGGGPTKGA